MRMEERTEETLAFPIRVFTLQEEVKDEEEVQLRAEEQLNEEWNREEEVKVCRQGADKVLTLLLTAGQEEAQQLTVQDGDGVVVFQVIVSKETDCCRVGCQSFLVTSGNLSVLLQFEIQTDMQKFLRLLWSRNDKGARERCEGRNGRGSVDGKSDGEKDPEPCKTACPSVPQYVQSHGCLSQQQNMLQDYLRTATYQRAILINEVDFRDKVVLDVGCGSGILSFFAVQAGAVKVYAVEANPMAKYAEVMVQSNSVSDRIMVLEGKMEEVSCPDMVDVIISEPIGYMLLNERMLESLLYARKWLKPNGRMFPSSGDIHLAPFTDEQLYIEHYARASFWQQRCFYGINLSSLHSAAVDEFFRQPIVDTFDMQILMATSVKHCIDFMEAKEEDVHRMEIPFVFTLLQSGLIHGLAFWFDVAFRGSRCLLQTPLFAKLGQTLSGTVLLTANKRQSYDIHITAMVDQSGFRSGNTLDLKNPFFRMPTWLHD